MIIRWATAPRIPAIPRPTTIASQIGRDLATLPDNSSPSAPAVMNPTPMARLLSPKIGQMVTR
jgi:hypothetical protein